MKRTWYPLPSSIKLPLAFREGRSISLDKHLSICLDLYKAALSVQSSLAAEQPSMGRRRSPQREQMRAAICRRCAICSLGRTALRQPTASIQSNLACGSSGSKPMTRLPVLILCKCVIGLEPLDPHAKFDCMDAVGCRNAVLPSEQIAHRRQIAARICSRCGDLRRPIEGCSAANDDCTDRAALYKSRQIDRCLSSEIERPSRKAKGSLIDDGRGYQVRFIQADYLFPQRHQG